MTQLRFTEQELFAEHAYAQPHIVAGHRLHGGFDAEGRYVSPHTLVRGPAIAAWTEALRARGGELMQADASLLAGARVPNTAQQKLLLQEGLGRTFWNTLTLTGHIEARGRVLAEISLPGFQDAVVEDLSEMAVGHLERGMLKLHGLDEGGEQSRGLGGHDVMWFALRDLAFGHTGFSEPEIPQSIARPEAGEPMPEIPRPQARVLSFLMNLLMIEFRAEIGFQTTERLLRDPQLFVDRRAQAEEAAEVVVRIRQDESFHVGSLRLYLGELRGLTFKGVDGGLIPGHAVIDPFWQGMVQWATVEQPQLVAARSRQMLAERIAEHPDAKRVQQAFDALGA